MLEPEGNPAPVVEPGNDDSASLAHAHNRIEALQGDVDLLRVQVGELQERGSGYARLDDLKPLPPELEQLVNDLREAEKEESGPNRTHRRYKRLFGG